MSNNRVHTSQAISTSHPSLYTSFLGLRAVVVVFWGVQEVGTGGGTSHRPRARRTGQGQEVGTTPSAAVPSPVALR